MTPELSKEFEQETECELSGRITMVVEKQWGRVLYVTDVSVILPDLKSYLCEKVIVYCSDQQNYRVGNQISALGTLLKFSKATNPGQFDEAMYYQTQNIDYKLMPEQILITDPNYSKYHAVLGNIKQKLITAYTYLLPEEEAGTLIAMLLGEKNLLDDEISRLYQENGITHILAISGLHVSMIGMCVHQLLKKLRLSQIIAIAGAIFFIFSYGVLTDFSVSTNRAVVMMVVMLLSPLLGKTYDMLSATALSALIILLQNPLQIFSAGFLLSFSAVLGIAVFLPCFLSLFPTKNPIAISLCLSISTQIATTPFILFYFYQFPSYSIITNLIILPFVTILTLSSIVAGIVGTISLRAGIFLIGGSNYILQFYEWICRLGSQIPGNLITVGSPGKVRILIYTLMIILFVYTVHRYNKKYLILIPVAAFIILLYPRQNSGLEITMLDVGQGEAIYMKNESGTTYLIDGGSTDVKKLGTYRLQPFLKFQGEDCIDYAIMTHSDEDHISGLMELIEKELTRINHLILPVVCDKDEAYIQLETLAKEKNIPVGYIKAGDVIKDGKFRMICLHPSPDFIANSANAYSTVLSITYGDFDLLLTGDLEEDGEKRVLELLKDREECMNYGITPAVDYDILKVAHHGSRNSTSVEFLQIIQPEVSLISCGKNNRYGHPHDELLERLDDIESEVVITYESGAITIRTDGKRMVVTTGVTKGRGN